VRVAAMWLRTSCSICSTSSWFVVMHSTSHAAIERSTSPLNGYLLTQG
jgi:hypothetical protein